MPTFMDQAPLKDKSFSMYLNLSPKESYMVLPGWDTEKPLGTVVKHDVIEKKFWALNLTGLSVGTKDVPVTGLMAIIDSGTSNLVGSTDLVHSLIGDIVLDGDCSNLGEMPDITFTIDSHAYVLKAIDYVVYSEMQCVMGF